MMIIIIIIIITINDSLTLLNKIGLVLSLLILMFVFKGNASKHK